MNSEPELVLILKPAPDEPPLRSAEFQKALSEFARSLRAKDVQVASRSFAFDAVHGGGGLTGTFGLAFFTLPPNLRSVIAAAVGAFLHNKYGRRARLKYGDVEAEASSVEEVEKLLRLVPKKESKQPHIGDSVSINGVEKKIVYVGWSDGIIELEGMPKQPIPISDLQLSNDRKNLWIFTGHTPRN